MPEAARLPSAYGRGKVAQSRLPAGGHEILETEMPLKKSVGGKGREKVKRFSDIVRRYKPRGWHLVEGDPGEGLDGYAESEPFGPVICVRPITSPYRLFVFLHEVGHVRMKHLGQRKMLPVHVQESEAEQFAIDAFDREGLPLPKGIFKACRDNVRRAGGTFRLTRRRRRR